MAQKAVQGNEKLAKQIKLRRNELGLTIEEAASRAGVGTKTWSRYEAGESIRKDKCKGICKALNWHNLPDQDHEETDRISIQETKKYKAWSKSLERRFGLGAAMSFAIGSDLLLDHLNEDLAELAALPIGTHIGQLGASWLKDILPAQFLMEYNYEFLHLMKCTLRGLRESASKGLFIIAHSVLDELIIYLCSEEASGLIELSGGVYEMEDDDESFKEWVFDLFDDMDLVTYLYSDIHLDENHIYHFSHWKDQQFYMD